MFHGKSTFHLGVRWARLNEAASGHMSGATNATLHGVVPYTPATWAFADFTAKHSFDGIGPSISWDAAVPIAGNMADGLSLDWGINVALLFGKQKTRTAISTKTTFYGISGISERGHTTQLIKRNESVMVPNAGGFAGISWRLPNAKISIGYKADYFFNAIDSGIDAVTYQNRAFYGPYASISIGLGSSDN